MKRETNDAADESGESNTTRLVVGAAVLVALLFGARHLGGYLPQVVEYVEGLGALGPLVFMLAYIVGVVAFLPGALLTLTGGALFDIGPGTVYVFVAATIGSALAFLASRYIARSMIEARLRENPRFAALDEAVGDQGRKIVFLLRLSPAFPFNFMNYALGLTRVSFRDYFMASAGMLPGTLLYVYYGKVAGDAAALAAGATVEKDASQYVVLALGLVATIAVTTIVTRIARKALAETTHIAEPADRNAT
ncbi:MAG: TVP38/TMEM64 family protein [Myxococcota bacterium]|jgi:uncharacterized membrane protein YdjX (TVP38/TMEM64 family)|nr:TVP38/TMEM64 family protein [Myxococcota bacterium]